MSWQNLVLLTRSSYLLNTEVFCILKMDNLGILLLGLEFIRLLHVDIFHQVPLGGLDYTMLLLLFSCLYTAFDYFVTHTCVCLLYFLKSFIVHVPSSSRHCID